jgi:hypothetical protein
VNGEFLHLTRWDCLCETTDIFQVDCTLDLFFVNVVNTLVCDDQGAFLCPIEHVRLLDLVGE